MERWANKIAVVTGASCGIGAACCRDLVDRGMIVVGLARSQEWMKNQLKASLSIEHQLRFHVIKCDLCNEADIIKAFVWVENNLGGVDVLINNAGIVRNTQIVSENNSADLRAVVDSNILGVAFCTREAFCSMKRRGVDGHVIIINSVAGHKVPSVEEMNLNIYPSTKFAVTAMTEVLRQEFLINGTKTKVTSISPGAVQTETFGSMDLPLDIPILHPGDISDAVIYCLETPPHVQIHEIIVKPVGEKF